jgi:hypothetical protein
MQPVISKREYRAPADILELESERLGQPKPIEAIVVSTAPLIGTWLNCDHETRGLLRVMIEASGNEVTLHGFGACSPTPCDWGTVSGKVYADNVTSVPSVAFTALYTFSFKQTTIIGHLFNAALIVETFDHFTDNSGRADYYSQYVMTK